MTETEEDVLLSDVMANLDALLLVMPVAHLRVRVMQAESRNLPDVTLPSGLSLKQQSRKARLWLDLIDEMEALRKE